MVTQSVFPYDDNAHNNIKVEVTGLENQVLPLMPGMTG